MSAVAGDSTTSARGTVSLLGQEAAQNMDVELMATPGFSIDQLMELAGLSVASAMLKAYPTETHGRVLVVAGPGNNGGDALVAARHLVHFGYGKVDLVYPKMGRANADLYTNLVTQCKDLGVTVSADMPSSAAISDAYDLVLDGVFGFSFSGAVRAPFDTVLASVKASGVPVVAIDIPSGWDVERGDVHGVGLDADMLVSLTAPKLCAVHFTGRYHYLGGRFVPPRLARKYQLTLPRYPGAEQVVALRHVLALAPHRPSARDGGADTGPHRPSARDGGADTATGSTASSAAASTGTAGVGSGGGGALAAASSL